ncbi:MAG: cell division protein ZipA [Oceanicoccus sp.]|uniref:cell division protein ZipA n=1 Tax=Oceanicoccus sp. TaxID=2691044 RepID=UPI00263A2918|nr:cell division protein ZipA [Oceanicoccus sp.]MCP3909089.1 cell division protein ZipA [Oceanicoccus sp.]MDG1773552.1 cell division protein ZipA [Oceanicoccus sp.]
MELNVRDWMIIVGVLLIIVVLLDGYRRMRNERRGNIRMSLNKQFLNSNGAGEESSSELPNGGARSVGRGTDGASFHDVLMEDIPPAENGNIDLGKSVPMLMDSVAAEPPVAEEDIITEPMVTEPEPEELVAEAEPVEEKAPELQEKTTEPQTGEQEVVVINIVAKDEPFKGPDLLHILLACDLRFGDMNIFHRHEQSNGKGPVQFSMANSVEPGYFDLDAIDDFSTPGVCFFMSVPGPEDAIKAFECMVETAQCLVSNLNGEMLDESRSAMTNQTLEHCRQRLRDFERRQLTHA